MPGGVAGTDRVLAFLAAEISTGTYLNLMAQYRPYYRAGEFPEIDRPVSAAEFQEALALAARHGLTRLDQRQPHLPQATRRSGRPSRPG
jgi:putative pyruvate formate lyase activating enzyme